MAIIGAGLGASRNKIVQNRDEVKRVIVGLVRSIDYMTSHRPEVIQIIQKKYGGMDKSMADYIYDLVCGYVTRSGLSSDKALQNALLGTCYEGKAANLTKLVDFSVAREVAEGK